MKKENTPLLIMSVIIIILTVLDIIIVDMEPREIAWLIICAVGIIVMLKWIATKPTNHDKYNF